MLREFKSDMIQLLANLALDLQGAPKAVKSPLKSPNKQLETHLAAHARDYRRETIAFSGPNTKQARIVTEQRLSPQRFVQKVNVSKKTKNTADYSLPQNLVKMLDRKPATTTIKILSRKDEFADSGANYMDPELRLFAIRSFGSKPNNVVPKPKRVAPWETKSAAIPISQLGGYYKDLVHQYSNRQ